MKDFLTDLRLLAGDIAACLIAARWALLSEWSFRRHVRSGGNPDELPF